MMFLTLRRSEFEWYALRTTVWRPWSSFSPHIQEFSVWPDRRIYRTDWGASKPSRSRRRIVYSGAVSKTDSVFHPIGLNDDQGVGLKVMLECKACLALG